MFGLCCALDVQFIRLDELLEDGGEGGRAEEVGEMRGRRRKEARGVGAWGRQNNVGDVERSQVYKEG